MPNSSARYARAAIQTLPGFRPRGAVRCPRVPPASISVEAVPRGAQEQGVPPGSAQDLDELEPIDRRDEVRTDRDGAVPLEQHGAAGSGSGSSVNAAAIRSARSVLPISPKGTNGRRGRSRAVSGRADGSGISPASVNPIDAGRWACATAPMSGPGGEDGEVDRQVRRGPATGGRPRFGSGAAERHDDEVLRFELVLAPPARRDQRVGRRRAGSRGCPRRLR